uniref:Uncharacterized protein n=1 Tax=Geobacter sp. (strain M21) TaxID=443144 RepID=C6E6Q2_GEOSM
MAVLVRHYLRVEPDQDIERFFEQYVEALWIEERQMTAMSNAVAKAFGGK